MVSRQQWIFFLIVINIFLLHVMNVVIEQWSFVPVTYSSALFMHDTLPEQKQFNRRSNQTEQKSTSDSAETGDNNNNNHNKILAAGENIYQYPEHRKSKIESNKINSPEHSTSRNQKTEDLSYQNVATDAITEREKVLQNTAQKHLDKCFNNCDEKLAGSKKSRYKFLQTDFKVNESLFSAFEGNETIVECDGKIEIHRKHFAILHDVMLHLYKWQATGLTEAGKKLHTFKSHKLRTDESEVLQPTRGLLAIYCPGKYAVRLDNASLENVLMLKYLTVHRQEKSYDKGNYDKELHLSFDYERRFTVAIQREDYANFYHIMLHMHSIFTMLMVFHQQPINMSVLLLDAHPEAEVDEMLATLYGPLIRVTKLKRNVKFQNLVLSLKEGKSILSKYWINSLPHLEEFRTFVYNQYRLNENHFLNCRKLTVTFIWRRDKIWHPRNLKGSVQRKIFNEAEIYKVVYDKYPNICVNGLLLESVPMKEQLKFIGKTDILIRMHGAGLTHALFLPKTSGFIELFPQNFRKMFHYYKLFEVIAKRRDLHYLYWENTISEHEMPNYFTRVDPVSFLQVVDSMLQKVCANNSQNY